MACRCSTFGGSETPVTFSSTAVYKEIASAHNIVINEACGFAYTVGSQGGSETCGGGLHMIDIQDPTNPTFMGCFADASTGGAGTGYTHDAQCIMYAGPDQDYQGREICLGSNETAPSIADVTDKANPRAISSAVYPGVGYLHQGWISEDHRYFFTGDESDELSGLAPRTRTLVWDIEDLDGPVLVREHLGVTTSTDHNLYISGHLMYQSNYASGLRATARRRSPRSDKLDPGRVVLGRNAHDAFAGSSSHANRLAEILLAHIVAIFRPCLPQLWPSADERSEVVTKNPDELRRRVEALEERGSKLCGAVGLVSASLDVDTIQQEVLDTPAGPREGGDVDVFV